MLAGVLLITARGNGKRRFPPVVPVSRDALVHDVLGFPSVPQGVRIARVGVPENTDTYRVVIMVLNKLPPRSSSTTCG